MKNVFRKCLAIVLTLIIAMSTMAMGQLTTKVSAVNASDLYLRYPVSGYSSVYISGTHYSSSHKGTDFGGNTNCNALAAADGVVKQTYTYSGNISSSTGGQADGGTRIAIYHASLGIYTIYKHLDEIYVSNGQSVKAGDAIGSLGNTGYSKGVHLHFDICTSIHNYAYPDKETCINPEKCQYYFSSPTPPTWATLTADKTSLPLGGSITFTMNSDTATYYNITILRSINSGTATEQSLQKLYHYSNTYTFTPTKEGKYTAFISAYNEIEPHADGNAVNFTVYGHPTWATLTADKTSLPLGESVTLTMRSDTATYYNITILRSINSGTATEQSLQKLYHYSNTYTFTPTIEGKYTAFISAYNEIEPHVDGNAVNFTVYDTSTQYTISYNANGGTGTPASQTGNGSITLSSAKPTRSNYTFLGWATTASATAAQYQPGASYNLTANTTLYAVWKQNPTPTTYTLTYNANGGSVSPASVNVTAGKSTTLPTPTRSGYTFTGWNTKSDGSGTTYKAGASYKPTANTTLYAQWKKNAVTPTTYTLTYNANGGTGAPAKQTGKGEITISNTRPTRKGYFFQGWATSAKATNYQYFINDKITLNKNITLYAVWKKNPASDAEVYIGKPKTVDYRCKVTLYATGKNIPDGYKLQLIEIIGSEYKIVAEGDNHSVSYYMGEVTSERTFKVYLLDKDGYFARKDSLEFIKEETTITVKSGLFDRIIAFFKGLFGLLPNVEIKP